MPNELLTTCSECGAQIVFHEDEDIVTCEYCYMKNARPKSTGDELAAMKRGNELRANCEFEEALKCYEYVLRKYPDEHEALWGKLLCKYGVETVEERRFGKVNRYHLCHRVRKTALRNEGDYRHACELAPAEVRAQYEKIAEYIDNVQSKVRAKVEGREGYEVFICYKETVPGTETPTLDSGIARELCLRYQKAGYNVFFAPYTLAGKAGEDYEAEIYLAVTTASVMIVIGTKPEYMNATWPKSEWSRYLDVILERDGLLIPLYRDMTAKQLPEAFRNLNMQGISMDANPNYAQDLEKILRDRLRSAPSSEPDGQVHPKYRRAMSYLMIGEFEAADDFFEQVLNDEPENAAAYIGKLCVERGVMSEEELGNEIIPLSESRNFKLALHFARGGQLERYEGYEREVQKRLEQSGTEPSPEPKKYDDAVRLFGGASVGEMRKSPDVIPSRANAGRDHEALKRQKFEEAVALSRSSDEEKLRKAIVILGTLGDYPGAAGRFSACREKLSAIENMRGTNQWWYDQATQLAKKGTVQDLQEAQALFESLGNYGDSKSMVLYCREMLKNLGSKPSSSSDEARLPAKPQTAEKSVTGEKAMPVEKVVSVEKVVPAKKNALAGKIAAGGSHTIGVKANGTVIAAGQTDHGLRYVTSWYIQTADFCPKKVKGWRDVVSVAAGPFHAVGLKSDGTVVVAGMSGADWCNTMGWRNIVAVAAGRHKTVGLKLDGTVVAVGDNSECQCNTEGWRNIIDIAAGTYHTVGLRADGTVVTVGSKGFGGCNTADWRDITAVAAGHYSTVGLKSDGTVVAVGLNKDGQCNTQDWRDIVAIAAGEHHTVGLKKDGAVVAVGKKDDGQLKVSGWNLL